MVVSLVSINSIGQLLSMTIRFELMLTVNLQIHTSECENSMLGHYESRER